MMDDTYETYDTYDAALSLLDRQILDDDGRMVGKVDDVAIEQADADGVWCITELLIGPGALGPRTGGLLGAWMASVWQRLSVEPHGGPGHIPVSRIDRIDSAVHLTMSRAEASVEGFETWVRKNVVDRIPGAK